MDAYRDFRYVRGITVKVTDRHMAIESNNFIPNFLLQSYTRGDSNEHDHNPDSNSSNPNFYYWCRYTTFIRFAAYNTFSNK